MTDVLKLCAGFPRRELAAGERILAEGTASGALFVLVSGALEVRKGPVRVTLVDEPGAFLGEISVLLGTTPTADVVAVRPTTVLVLSDPAAVIHANPALALAIARLLARRLQAVTTYLADIKRQYGGAGGHLGVMDKVLVEITRMRPRSLEPGSERKDVPDY